jgi:hypothetical protein
MSAQLFTRRHLGLLAVLCLAPAGPVLAQTATPGTGTPAPGTPASGTPARVRATIDTVNANGLVLTTRAGEKLAVALTDGTVVVALIAIRLEDIKPGSFIGSAAMPQPDGTQRALEVHVFPESMRGQGEGHRPFDLQPQSTMTNGTVGAVTGNVGRTLTVSYQGGEKTIVVPQDTPIVTYEPGTRAMLAAGAHVIVMGTRAEDGKVTASRISVGKNGLVPPM